MEPPKQLPEHGNPFAAFAEQRSERKTLEDFDCGPMVTIFKREYCDTSEEDEAVQEAISPIDELSHARLSYVRGDLSAASLPRVNCFKTKWLKQSNPSNNDKLERQTQQQQE